MPAYAELDDNQWDNEPDDAILAAQAKRDRKRREMVDRVEGLRKSNLDRRELVFHELLSSLHTSHLSLLAHPAPTEATYLLRLSELSVQRDMQLAAARQSAARKQDLTISLHQAEVARIEEEHELAKKGIKERLLEACEERAKKLREEKDGVELLSLEAIMDPAARPHATRHRAGAGRHRTHVPYNEINNGTTQPDSNHTEAPAMPQHMSMGSFLAGSIKANAAVQVPLPGASEATGAGGGGGPIDLFSMSLLPSSPMLSSYSLASYSLIPTKQAEGSGTSSKPTANLLIAPHNAAILSTLASLPLARGPGNPGAVARGKRAQLPAYLVNP